MTDISPIFENISTAHNQYHVKYKFYTMSLKAGLRYTYSKFKLRPSISGGFSYINIIKNDSKLLTTKHSPTKYEVKKNHTGAYLSFGLDYNIRKNQSIFIQFHHDFYVESDLLQDDSAAYIKNWQLKVGYTF